MIDGSRDISRWVRVSVAVFFFLIVIALAVNYLSASEDLPSYPYSQMLADAAAGDVESIVQEGNQLTVAIAGASEARTVQVASDSVNVYAEVCAATGNPPGPACPIRYEVLAPSESGQILGYLIMALLPVVLIGAFFFFMMRAARQKKE